MDLGITGKKALVCAASRGLGRGCADALAREGVDLTLVARTAGPLEEAAATLRRDCGVRVATVCADITSEAGRAAALAACPDPDILVNNNGGPPYKDFRELDREAMLTGVTMNMVTPIELIQATIGDMIERRFGRIVNITSVSVKMPVFGLDLSSGARGGLTAFLAGVARGVAQHNVTINHILPGYFDTDRLRGGIKSNAKVLGKSENELAVERAAEVPAGRFGTPEEFGECCAFLCSVPAGYITGQSLLLDGGLYRGVM